MATTEEFIRFLSDRLRVDERSIRCPMCDHDEWMVPSDDTIKMAVALGPADAPGPKLMDRHFPAYWAGLYASRDQAHW